MTTGEKFLQFRSKWRWAITPVLLVIYFLGQYWYDSEHKKPIKEVKEEIAKVEKKVNDFKADDFKPLKKKVEEVLTNKNYYKMVEIAEELNLTEWKSIVKSLKSHNERHEKEDKKIEDLEDKVKDLESEVKILKIKLNHITNN